MMTTTVIPVYGVNLSPDDALSGFDGRTVTYTLHITNTGNMADSFDLAIFDNTWTTTLSDSHVDLSAGAGATVTVAVDISADALVNDVDVATITATSQGNNSKCNTSTLTTTVARVYGVELSPDDASVGKAGETVTYTLFVTNTGNVSDTFDLILGGNNWTTTLSSSSIMLAARTVTTFTVVVEIPSSVIGYDKDSATITVTSRNDGTIKDAVILKTSTKSLMNWNYLPIILSG